MSSKDDKVEAFFRKASNHYKELEVNEDDWKKMEARLDAEAANSTGLTKTRRKRGAAMAGGVILILLTAYWLSTSFDVGSTVNTRDKARQLSTQSAGESDISPADTGIKADVNPGDAADNARFDTNPDATGNSGLRSRINTNSAAPDRSTSRVQVQPKNKASQVQDNEIKDTQHVVGFGLNPPDHLHQQPGVRESEASPIKEVVRQQPEDTLQARDKEVDIVDEMAGDQDKPLREASRWSLSLLAAPDFSTTPNSTYTSPGNAFGVGIHFRFADRWLLNTGALYSKKVYWGYGSEYHPPYGYWDAVTNGVVPEKIDGTCDVIEIPVSVAFNLLEKGRSRLFVSAGVSSYFMQSEHYTYTFDSPNPGSAEGWSTEKPSEYWFGIGSLSVGYDWRVNSSLSLGVEPYFKIPFEELGWANIDLFSTGILFAARYRFFKGSRDRPPSNAP